MTAAKRVAMPSGILHLLRIGASVGSKLRFLFSCAASLLQIRAVLRFPPFLNSMARADQTAGPFFVRRRPQVEIAAELGLQPSLIESGSRALGSAAPVTSVDDAGWPDKTRLG